MHINMHSKIRSLKSKIVSGLLFLLLVVAAFPVHIYARPNSRQRVSPSANQHVRKANAPPAAPQKVVTQKAPVKQQESSVRTYIQRKITEFKETLRQNKEHVVSFIVSAAVIAAIVKEYLYPTVYTDEQGVVITDPAERAKKITESQLEERRKREQQRYQNQRNGPAHQRLNGILEREARQLNVVRQELDNDCGLHAIANAAAINQCLRLGIPVEQGVAQRSPAFYQQGSDRLGFLDVYGRPAQDFAGGLDNRDIMLLAKRDFGMDNCSLIHMDNGLCHTTNQPLADLREGVVDNNGLDGGVAPHNHTIAQMINRLRGLPVGALHFICGIHIDEGSAARNQGQRSGRSRYSRGESDNHWILISLIKERHNNHPSTYIAYCDSNNTPLRDQPHAQQRIDYIRQHFANRLAA